LNWHPFFENPSSVHRFFYIRSPRIAVYPFYDAEREKLTAMQGHTEKYKPIGLEIFQGCAPYHPCIAEVSATIFASEKGVKATGREQRTKCDGR
jgi:hypothetical protein